MESKTKKSLGLYLHIPFCRSKCRYCDFCSFPNVKEETVGKYCRKLEKDIAEYGARFSGYTVDTVFFGGGTPTFLPPRRLVSLLEKTAEHFELSPDAEITTECNPATIDRAGLALLKEGGFNRLSIGVQSLNDRELRALGRCHTAADAVHTLCDARAVGFENISADVMFGIPHMTRKSLERTLGTLFDLSPEHISLYGLQIEEGTPFYEEKDSLRLPSEEQERAMYFESVDALAAHDYLQYEISNFAKKGFEARHNLRYWRREDYLGLGITAASCIEEDRFTVVSGLEEYGNGIRITENERVSEHDRLCESVMLGMRLSAGCDFDALAALYGEGAREYEKRLAAFVPQRLVMKTTHGMAFTREGMYLSNSVLSDVLDFEGE